MSAYHLHAVAPVGTARAVAIICPPGEVREVNSPTYPNQGGVALRAARVAADLVLREAARLLGLRAVELSGLEVGRLAPDDPAAWGEWMRMLRPATGEEPTNG